MSIQIEDFGKLENGQETKLYAIKNAAGMEIRVSNYGATLVNVFVTDKNGDKKDVVLGYDDAEGYEKSQGMFFGATVGRSANRIGKARFTLNGTTYQLDENDHGNNLHSGNDYYSKRMWDVKAVSEDRVVFLLHSEDGDQGYPGALDMEVTYQLTNENELQISYYGTPSADTIINMTNHSYFNLNGHAFGDILSHEVWLLADYFTRSDEQSIPTGELVDVTDTPMDFREKKKLGRDIEQDYEALNFGGGYDHNYTLNNYREYEKVAEMTGDESGITMEVYTDLPGLQLYTGNFISEEPGKEGAIYHRRQAVCFETQYYPDAVNKKNFQNPVCHQGETYVTKTSYRFFL
ncbi:MAG: aldose epimerase family protein [Lachnospiraceae bacterium]